MKVGVHRGIQLIQSASFGTQDADRPHAGRIFDAWRRSDQHAAVVDFAVIDMERGSFTIAQTADMIAWLKAAEVALPSETIPC